jgi:predicted AlkP superfamily pyrophosphatase or phosphodiesterase
MALTACAGAPESRELTTSAPPPAPARPAPDRHVIVVSIDGLMPASYLDPDAHGLEVPTLRAMRAGGAYAEGVMSVLPTVTYPAHTSIATGAWPATHGIGTNTVFDPLEKNLNGWYWYAEDIAVPTIWDAAREAGLRTALINWPVTVGARATALVPEYWRAGTEDDAKLARAMSTPGLLDAVQERFPDLWDRFTPPHVADAASVDVAVHLLETAAPNLMLVHTWMVDEYQHRSGPWSDQARARIETADAQLARLIEAAQRAGIWERTTIVVVSDHGFVAVDTTLRPGALVKEHDLVTLDDAGKVIDWRVGFIASAGTTFFYLKDEGDTEALARLQRVLTPMASGEGATLRTVYDRDAIRELRGDPTAVLAVEAADGHAFAGGYDGPWISPGHKGQHGFDPRRPEMQAALLIYGPGIAPGVIPDARLVDVAPTIAGWLELDLPTAEGRPLAMPGQ